MLKSPSWQSPCVGVDCGDRGSCVANFAAGQEGTHCSYWLLGSAGESCDTVCTGAPGHLGCHDGDWAVHNEASARAALAAASDDANTLCSDYSGYSGSYPGRAGDGHCYFPFGSSSCSAADPSVAADIRRLCPCRDI